MNWNLKLKNRKKLKHWKIEKLKNWKIEKLENWKIGKLKILGKKDKMGKNE